MMVFNLRFFIIDYSNDLQTIGSWIYFCYLTVLFGLMLYTGRISFYRRIFFVSIALLFFPSFMSNLLETRGSFTVTAGTVANSETPFCHIVIPITLIPAALSKTIIFPARLTGDYAAVYSMLGIWLAGTIVMGRGWCSWVCFYGGWDEGFSRIRKKRVLNLDNADPRIKSFSFAMLIFLVLVSMVTLTSIYCEWFCPFKLVTEFEEIIGIQSYIAAILFILLFFSLVVVLPILTRKRVQCAVFCPFGAFQSLTNKINLYTVRISKDKCSKCMACVEACPTLSLSTDLIKSGKEIPLITCTKCGECIDVCKNDAVKYDYKVEIAKKWKLKISPAGSRRKQKSTFKARAL